ncbi:MAG: hypothetical protein AAB262_05575, partial [Elusimicrobiota bacterium]
MRFPDTPQRRALAVFLAAAALRLLLWSRMLHHPEAYMRPDSTDYLRLADSILRGAFEGATGAPDTLRTPGYPALLALLQLVSGDPRWAALVNIMLDAGTAALIASTAAILAPGPWSWTAGL